MCNVNNLCLDFNGMLPNWEASCFIFGLEWTVKILHDLLILNQIFTQVTFSRLSYQELQFKSFDLFAKNPIHSNSYVKTTTTMSNQYLCDARLSVLIQLLAAVIGGNDWMWVETQACVKAHSIIIIIQGSLVLCTLIVISCNSRDAAALAPL